MNVQQADNIWMIAKVLQEHDFTKSPLRVRLVAEGVCIDQSANTKHVTIPFEIGPLANRLRLTGSYPPTHTHYWYVICFGGFSFLLNLCIKKYWPNIFLTATMLPVFLSIAFHTIPYACHNEIEIKSLIVAEKCIRETKSIGKFSRKVKRKEPRDMSDTCFGD